MVIKIKYNIVFFCGKFNEYGDVHVMQQFSNLGLIESETAVQAQSQLPFHE